jgi:hypothetical protein
MAECEIRTTPGKAVESALALILADTGPTYNAGLALSWKTS